MDAISSSLSPITAILPPASAAAAVAAAASDTQVAEPINTGPSIRTFFSDFAHNLLAQQRADPTLAIDAALTRNLLSPSLNYSVGGQLYTSAGLLQQYVTSQFLAQLDSSTTAAADNGTSINTPGFSFFSSDSSKSLISFLNSYEQISLIGGLSLFNTSQSTRSDTGTTTTPQPSVKAVSTSTHSTTSTPTITPLVTPQK
jgi:hypothetical protein